MSHLRWCPLVLWMHNKRGALRHPPYCLPYSPGKNSLFRNYRRIVRIANETAGRLDSRLTIRISRTKLAKQPLSDPHNISRELAPLLAPPDHSSRSINFPCDADLWSNLGPYFWQLANRPCPQSAHRRQVHIARKRAAVKCPLLTSQSAKCHRYTKHLLSEAPWEFGWRNIRLRLISTSMGSLM